MTDEALVRLLAASERANELLQKASAWSVAHEEARLRLRDLPPALAAAEGAAPAVLRGLHSEMVSEFHSVTAMRLPEQESMGSGLSSDSERAIDTGVSELVHLTTQSLVDLRTKLEQARSSAGDAHDIAQSASTNLDAGLGDLVAAGDELVGSVGESSQSASDAEQTVVEAAGDAISNIQSALSEAADTCEAQGTEFGSFIGGLLLGTVRSRTSGLIAASRSAIQSEVQVRIAQAVDELVAALGDAGNALRDGGREVGRQTGESSSLFERLSRLFTSVSAKAPDIIAEDERLKREEEEKERGGGDD